MSSYQHISFEIKNDLVWIGLGLNEKKSMTTLTRDSLAEIKLAIEEASAIDKKKSAKGLVIFSHKPGVFLAGMDISVINDLKNETEALRNLEEAHRIFNGVEDLKMPTAALVDGVCLGGGLELSLCCKKIFVSDSPKTALGLPEVMLGVLPGFGGTYRLPKKVGLPAALDMILTGKQIKGKNAYKMGLADAILPAERMQELAPQYLLNKKTGKKKTLKEELEKVAIENFLTRKIIFQKAREKVLETSKGFYPAPLKILEVLETGAGKGRADYLAMEAQAFAELSQSVQSKNLQHIFFLTDQSKKLDNKDQLPSVKRGAVLGAGVMGGGIAWLFAHNNQSPIMKDLTPEALELGLKQASQNFSGALKRRRMTEDEFNRKMLHFFNPVNKMPLVEIITHEGVNPKTVQTLVKWVLDVKKTPIVVKDGPGFLVNRILAPYLNEAAFLLEEGVSVEKLDAAALNFGMPMGPCKTSR